MKKFVITLTGPSCSGKSTLESMLVRMPGFHKVISHTTRSPRPGEQDGIDYYFVTKDEFESLEAQAGFAETVEFNGNKYGAAVSEFSAAWDKATIPVVVVEPEGCHSIMQFCEQVEATFLPIFIMGPADLVARRFINRTMGEVAMALGCASGEMERVVEKASARLAVMMDQEVHWRPIQHENAMTVSRFDSSNEAQVIARITRRIEGLSEGEPSTYKQYVKQAIQHDMAESYRLFGDVAGKVIAGRCRSI